jgi:hypothetical protein
MSLVISGRVWKFGDDINTDYMAPGFVKNQPWDVVKNLTRGTELAGTPLPPELVRIVAAGGMMQLLKQEAGAPAA